MIGDDDLMAQHNATKWNMKTVFGKRHITFLKKKVCIRFLMSIAAILLSWHGIVDLSSLVLPIAYFLHKFGTDLVYSTTIRSPFKTIQKYLFVNLDYTQ